MNTSIRSGRLLGRVFCAPNASLRRVFGVPDASAGRACLPTAAFRTTEDKKW
jgi:hypothetical protein